jgi:hypothetical protein
MTAYLSFPEDAGCPSTPILNLIAYWKNLYEYGQLTGAAPGDDAEWRQATFQWNGATDPTKRVVLQNVELVVQCACNFPGWRLCQDPEFASRNRRWLLDTGQSARLTEAALEEWDRAPDDLRSVLLEEADGRVFAFVVAHGTEED